LNKLPKQQTSGLFSFSVVVCDNDVEQSAAPVVAATRESAGIDITYCWEPRKNIALARNKALEHARGNFIAFIDDDEFPADDWLTKLMDACNAYCADGVLGPVRPHFESPPPRWVVRGGFCERPEHATGRKMPWDECRTGNLLFRKQILDGITEPFRTHFGTGGEDMDFFRRMVQHDRLFIWCNEAVAYETVPPLRWRRSYMLKRALLRGKNILNHSSGAWRFVAVSLAAVPLYLLVLPITIVLGQHWFMKYSIKLCDHSGRLLAILGLNPVTARDM
jgi:cellulose synthase/poly-beta-1,6-N-acetylglucosamine synthase-like glycosyltransferase